MAWYKDNKHLKLSSSGEFDKTHPPSTAAPHSGIYRCEVCRKEVASNAGQPLPPQNHSQHPQNAKISWRLIVYADHDPQ